MLIRAIATELCRAAGVEAKEEHITMVETAIHHQFHGERIYITAQPKDIAERMAKKAQYNARRLADLTGLSVRQARRKLGGK